MPAKYAYIMYKGACTNKGTKHPTKEIVSVDAIKKFRENNAVGREYQVKCGSGYCPATIGVIGDSLVGLRDTIDKKRVQFVNRQHSRAPSNLSSSNESNAPAALQRFNKATESGTTAAQKLSQSKRIAEKKIMNLKKAIINKSAPCKRPRVDVRDRDDENDDSSGSSRTITFEPKPMKTSTKKQKICKTVTVSKSPLHKMDYSSDTSTHEVLPKKNIEAQKPRIIKTQVIVPATRSPKSMKQAKVLSSDCDDTKNRSPVLRSRVSRVPQYCGSTSSQANSDIQSTSCAQSENETPDEGTSKTVDERNELFEQCEELHRLLDTGPSTITNTGDDINSEVARMKTVTELYNENRTLRALNLQLQLKLLTNTEKVEATFGKIEDTAKANIRQRIHQGQDMPIGFVDIPQNKIHAGYGIWIDKNRYDRLRLRTKVTPSIFISNVARLIFTDDVMRASSVTGTISNVHKRSGQNTIKKKPALNATGLDAVAAISRFWMKRINMAEDDITKHLAQSSVYIAKKIADMNRSKRPRGNTKKMVTFITETDDSTDTVDNNTTHTADHVDSNNNSSSSDEIESQKKGGCISRIQRSITGLPEYSESDMIQLKNIVPNNNNDDMETDKENDGPVENAAAGTIVDEPDVCAKNIDTPTTTPGDCEDTSAEKVNNEGSQHDDSPADAIVDHDDTVMQLVEQIDSITDKTFDDWLFDGDDGPKDLILDINQ